MGLLTGKDDDLNTGLALEKMMKEFDIDLDDEVEEATDEDEVDRINRRREKLKKERE